MIPLPFKHAVIAILSSRRTGGVALVANGATIPHSLNATPRTYGATVSVASHIVCITSVDATNLTIGLNTYLGAPVIIAENISWWAEV